MGKYQKNVWSLLLLTMNMHHENGQNVEDS